MSVMDKLFGTTNAVQGTSSTAQPPAAIGNSAPTVNNPMAGSGNAINNGAANNSANGNEGGEDTVEGGNSPLDVFSKLWDTPVDAQGKPIALPADPLASDIFNFDPTVIKKQAAALDFVKDVNPELVAKVVAGGQDAGPALLELLNQVQQGAFAAGTLSTSNLVNKAFQKHNVSLNAALPRRIKAVQLGDTELGENPVLSHPAVQPLVNALRTTIFTKDPNANPADVAKQVENYIKGLSEAITSNDPQIVKQKQETAAASTNWDTFFEQR